MNSLNLKQFQDEVHEWEKRNFGEQEPIWPLLGVGEELGELNHAVLKMKQGIRGSTEEHRAAMIDAVGDLVVFLAAFCARTEIDLEDAIVTTWTEVRKRNWRENPLDGRVDGGPVD